MAILTLTTALNQARTLLNDDTAVQFPDPVLIPKAQIAHQELQTALWDCGSPIIRKVSAGISIPANTTSLASVGSAMPVDLLVPYFLSEAGSPAGPWTPMTEVYYISQLQNQNPPIVPVGSGLIWWSWIGDDIQFIGCTSPRYIQITYRKSLLIPAAAADSLGVPFAEQYIGPRIAALAGGSVGSPTSLQSCTEMANTNLAKVIKANRGSQMPAVKP
jgi:hypothetical protein